MTANDHLVTRSAELLSVQISMAAVAVLAVALRLISRFLIIKSPGWDDYIIILGMVNTTSNLFRGPVPHINSVPWFDHNRLDPSWPSLRRRQAHGRRKIDERSRVGSEGLSHPFCHGLVS